MDTFILCKSLEDIYAYINTISNSKSWDCTAVKRFMYFIQNESVIRYGNAIHIALEDSITFNNSWTYSEFCDNMMKCSNTLTHQIESRNVPFTLMYTQTLDRYILKTVNLCNSNILTNQLKHIISSVFKSFRNIVISVNDNQGELEFGSYNSNVYISADEFMTCIKEYKTDRDNKWKCYPITITFRPHTTTACELLCTYIQNTPDLLEKNIDIDTLVVSEYKSGVIISSIDFDPSFVKPVNINEMRRIFKYISNCSSEKTVNDAMMKLTYCILGHSSLRLYRQYTSMFQGMWMNGFIDPTQLNCSLNIRAIPTKLDNTDCSISLKSIPATCSMYIKPLMLCCDNDTNDTVTIELYNNMSETPGCIQIMSNGKCTFNNVLLFVKYDDYFQIHITTPHSDVWLSTPASMIREGVRNIAIRGGFKLCVSCCKIDK